MKIKRHEFILPGILTIMFGMIFAYIAFIITKVCIYFVPAIGMGIVISIAGFVFLSWGIELKGDKE